MKKVGNKCYFCQLLRDMSHKQQKAHRSSLDALNNI